MTAQKDQRQNSYGARVESHGQNRSTCSSKVRGSAQPDRLNWCATLTIDKAGRVVIPKPLRDQLHLNPGDILELEAHGEIMTMRPVRPVAPLRKERG